MELDTAARVPADPAPPLDSAALPQPRIDRALLLALALLGGAGGLAGCATTHEESSIPWAKRGENAERWDRESLPPGIAEQNNFN